MTDKQTTSDHEIVQIIPCSDWNFRHQNDGQADSVYPVAAWALLQNGGVIGLIPARGAVTERNIARLVPPPPLGGSYELTPRERETAISNIISGHEPRDRYRPGQDSDTDHFARADVVEMLKLAYAQGYSNAGGADRG
ncbi:hypothetical protein [Gluconacetobacter diazotrophicus]|uniref:hypothetical protein n=1 Tax=Gluconacetobacter diazotrophicus TaxID=33996 RepID=UPI001604DF7F|nr:hypothetical protein [Gluconacetobacter diazotrophicus]